MEQGIGNSFNTSSPPVELSKGLGASALMGSLWVVGGRDLDSFGVGWGCSSIMEKIVKD